MKTLYRETYKRPYPRIKVGLTPVCRHQAEGYDVAHVELHAAGKIEDKGEQLEYQDLRIFFRERAK